MKKFVLALLTLAAAAASAEVLREADLPSAGLPLFEQGARFSLPSLDGGAREVVLRSVQSTPKGVSAFGRTAGSLVNNVALTARADGRGCVVTVTDPATRNQVSYRLDGAVWQVRESAPVRGACGCPRHRVANPELPDGTRASRALSGDPLVDGAAIVRNGGETNTNVIDVLIAVDLSAQNWIRWESDFGGEEDALEQFARQQIARVNAYYANTGLDEFFTFNLAGVFAIDRDLSLNRDRAGYVDSQLLLEGLADAYGRPTTAWGRQVQEYRDRVGADIVSLLVSCGEGTASGLVGLGYALDNDSIQVPNYPDNAANVCLIESVANGNTLAHEIGHNMGAGHSEMYERTLTGAIVPSSNSGPQLYDYSKGYTFNDAYGTRCTTIMGYNYDGWEFNSEIDMFSSASHQLVGEGIAIGDEKHDNTRLLSLTYPLVANFRTKPPTFDQDGAAYEFKGGVAIEPVVLSVNSNAAASVAMAVAGLPAGLSFNAATHTVSGVPAKAGRFDVSVTITYSGTKKATFHLSMSVADFAVEAVAAEGGKVTGGGRFLAGQKVALAATPAAGYVFAGWYLDEAMTEPAAGADDFRAPKASLLAADHDQVFHAKFIPVADDAAGIDAKPADEYATGVAIEPFTLDLSACTSLPTVKVAGLPAGLKFTAKALDVRATAAVPAAHYEANTVYGTPTKSGVYVVTATVTTAGRKSAEKTFKMIVRKDGEALVDADWDADRGKVAGLGVYAKGAKASLKATANKGFVFAGWYADAAFDTPLEGAADYRTAAYAYVSTGEDVVLHARFLRSEEDAGLALFVGDREITEEAADTLFKIDGAFGHAIRVVSGSIPKLALSGLPAGLKFDAKTNQITGSATKPGAYVVTAKLTNTTVKKAETRKFTVRVNNLTAANAFFAEPLANAPDESYRISAGASHFVLPSLALASGSKLTVAGLPAGLKFDAKTGVVSGVATKPGVYTVTLTVDKQVSTFTVEVEALPEWGVGVFQGLVSSNDVPCGICDLTAAAAGKITGKLQQNGVSGAFTIASYADVEEASCSATGTVKIGTAVLPLALAATPDGISGAVEGDLRFVATVNHWKDKAWADQLKKAHAAVLAEAKKLDPKATAPKFAFTDDATYPDAPAEIALTLAANGTVKAAAKYVTGRDARGKDVVYAASASAVLLEPDFAEAGAIRGTVVVHFPPKAGKFPGFTRLVEVEFR